MYLLQIRILILDACHSSGMQSLCCSSYCFNSSHTEYLLAILCFRDPGVYGVTVFHMFLVSYQIFYEVFVENCCHR
jgi:hypothetical protein